MIAEYILRMDLNLRDFYISCYSYSPNVLIHDAGMSCREGIAFFIRGIV